MSNSPAKIDPNEVSTPINLLSNEEATDIYEALKHDTIHARRTLSFSDNGTDSVDATPDIHELTSSRNYSYGPGKPLPPGFAATNEKSDHSVTQSSKPIFAVNTSPVPKKQNPFSHQTSTTPLSTFNVSTRSLNGNTFTISLKELNERINSPSIQNEKIRNENDITSENCNTIQDDSPPGKRSRHETNIDESPLQKLHKSSTRGRPHRRGTPKKLMPTRKFSPTRPLPRKSPMKQPQTSPLKCTPPEINNVNMKSGPSTTNNMDNIQATHSDNVMNKPRAILNTRNSCNVANQTVRESIADKQEEKKPNKPTGPLIPGASKSSNPNRLFPLRQARRRKAVTMPFKVKTQTKQKPVLDTKSNSISSVPQSNTRRSPRNATTNE